MRRMFFSGALCRAAMMATLFAAVGCADKITSPEVTDVVSEPRNSALDVTDLDPIDPRAPGYYRYDSPHPDRAYGGGLTRHLMSINLSEPTLMRGRATGNITKTRSNATYVWGAAAGTPTYPVDPDGYASGGGYDCTGGIILTFINTSSIPSYGVYCTRNGTNLVDALPRSPRDTTFVVQGQGHFERDNSIDRVHQLCGLSSQPACFTYFGQQTMELVPDRQYLTVTGTQGYEGDSVTFTASAGSYSIVVREWVWVPDSASIMPQTVACSGTSNVCKTRVYSPGRMYVRARVNTSPWRVEQAFTRNVPTPVQLIATPVRSSVVSGDTVSVILSTLPSGRSISNAAVATGGSATVLGSNCVGSTCVISLQSGGTVAFSATVIGSSRQAVATIATTMCETGFPLLDDPDIRRKLVSLFDSSLANAGWTSRKELKVFFVRRNGQTLPLMDPAADPKPCSPGAHLPTLQPGDTLIAHGHTHPAAPGERMNCPSPLPGLIPNDTSVYAGGLSGPDLLVHDSPVTYRSDALGFPTTVSDPNPLYGVPSIVIDKTTVYLRYMVTGLDGIKVPQTYSGPWATSSCNWRMVP